MKTQILEFYGTEDFEKETVDDLNRQFDVASLEIARLVKIMTLNSLSEAKIRKTIRFIAKHAYDDGMDLL